MIMFSAISTARSWVPLILWPHRCLKNIVDCFRSYDPSEWDPPLELLDSGIKLGMDILLPALLLSLIGSFLPSSSLSLGKSIDGSPSYLINAFAPYAAHSSGLSLQTPATNRLLSNFDLPYFLRLTALSILSPTTMDIVFHHFAPILIKTFSRLKFVLTSRKGPDASAKAAILERVRSGRLIRRHAYDLYLPSKASNEKVLDNPITSLLFFPGFGLAHSAYADVASKISDYGIPVAMVSLEPMRLAHQKLGGGMDDVRRLIKSAGKEVVRYYKLSQKDNSMDTTDGGIVVEWEIGGHSMGGYNALQLAEELQTNNELPSITLNDGSISRVGSQIVAWAAGSMVQGVPNLRQALPLRVLVLLASRDSIAKITSTSSRRELLSKLPAKSKLDTIKGGNHSGFASYDTASKKSSTFLMNGPRDIPLEVQHEEASSRTARFLLNK